MPYRVERRTSTRASADPGSPDYERWIEWEAGDVVAEIPEHVAVGALVEAGAMTPTDDEPGPARRSRKAAA